jgi:O-antigen/teichoic acid export membrane protein
MLKDCIQRIKTYVGGGRLRAKALQGGTLLGIGSVIAQVTRFGRNIVLTRILAPESFGVMAIVLSVSSIMDTFTEIGIKEAVIQNENGHEDQYINSAWWLSFVRSLFIYGLIFVCAPHVAIFYHNSKLTSLMRVALLSVVFNGAMSPRAFVALKLMNFKQWAYIQYGSNIAGTLLTVSLTFVLRNVWALAIGFAAEYAILCIVSYILCPFRPSYKIQKESARDLLRFSQGIFGLSFLNLIFARTDIFVLGRVISAEQLGYYTIATYLAQVPSYFAMNWLGQILMPIFSHLKQDHARINDTFAKVTSTIVILFMPAFIFVILTGRTLLSVLYGPRYAFAFWPLVLAVLVAFVNIANAQITTVLYAAGKPQLHRICVAIMAFVMVVLIYPAVHLWGIAGAQLAALLAVSVGYTIQIWQIRHLTGFRFSQYVKRYAISLAVALCVFGVAMAARPTLAFSGPLFSMIYGTGTAMIALAGSAFVVVRQSRDRSIGVATT